MELSPEQREKKRAREKAYYWQTRERRLELNKQRYQNNKEQFYKTNRKGLIKRKYNLSVEEYDRMFEAQNHCCYICHKEETTRVLSVDHNHQTGEVRKLLCGSCNRALGLFKDSLHLLERATEYLRAHGGSD